jgi:serine/threonine protein kinase
MTVFSTQIPGYEIIRELGVGGMATVYLAIQRSLDRKVAIKVMKRSIDDLDKFERRFLMEGRTMAKLPHRNIVAVYDIVKNDDVTYIAMEYLDGGTLSTKMKEGLSLAEAISVVVQIAQALQFAHEHGIVHRDLKPANIMFRDTNTPVLTDFGIAKHQDASATRLTQTGMLVGTPTYMSPEQINALEVDGRSDLYSLGVLFYELLTGAPPFQADTPIAVLMAHLTSPAPPLPGAFAEFQPVLDMMLAKNRDERFPNLKEFTRALKGSVVHNQNLLARLQSDPNQSSSEQLRALGFSVSGGESIQTPHSGQIRLPPSGRTVPRTPTPGPMSSPTQVSSQSMAAPQAPARRPPWLWIGVGAAVAGLLLTAILLWPRSGINEEDRRIVEIVLAEVDRNISAKDLIKAAENLRVAEDKAPQYDGVVQRRATLVEAYRSEANAAVAAGDFDTAFARIEQAKLVDESNAELVALAERIKQQRADAESARAVADTLARADAASKSGRDLEAGGAYSILSQARAQNPDNAQIKQRLDALIERALKPARDALTRRDLQGAINGVRGVEATLANEQAWQRLRAEVDAALGEQAERVRLMSALAAVDQQIQAGKLVSPANDNAQLALAELLLRDPKNPEVLKRQTALAAALTQQAQRQLEAGQAEAALQSANEALNVKPDYAQAQTVAKSAAGRLDANRAKVIEGLAAASQAVAELRFVAPAGNNARDLLNGVLKLDAANAEAQALLASLPQRIAESVRARVQAGDVAAAQRLVADGRKAYPGDTQLAQVAELVGAQVAQVQAREARNRQFDRIAQMLAARPLRADNIGAAAKEIASLLAVNPRDVDAVTAKQRLFDALGQSLSAATSSAEIDQVQAALKQAQLQFSSDPAAAQLASAIDQARQRVVAAEQARLASISGELVINAYPWARVESVVDANRKPVSLPDDTVTPLRLQLPEGVYYVTFRHPDVQRSATQVARVQAKKSVATSASFASSVTARDYLRRAGF